MTRSVWKGPFIDVNVVKRFDEIVGVAFKKFRTHYRFENTVFRRKFLKPYAIEIFDIAKKISEEEPIEVWSRRSFISPEFLGFSFLVYNGHVYKRLIVKRDMIGRKFGEFAISKRLGTNIHYPSKRKKKEKKVIEEEGEGEEVVQEGKE